MRNDVISDDTLNQQHKAIRAHIQQILRISEDIEKMKLLTSANITPEQLKAINYTWYHMKNTFTYLEDCLKVHWELEGQVLPRLIGDCVANSICSEHAEIRKKINILNDYFLKDNPQDWFVQLDYLIDNTTQLNRMMLRHREKEDAIFDLHKERA